MSFREVVKSEVIPALQKELGLKNANSVPTIKSVKINVGIGTLTKNTKDYSEVVKNIALISGQKPVISSAKKSISNFKLREGMPVGVAVTLRGDKMYEFLYRLINVVFPRVRDFRGLNPKSFDGTGNYSIGFKESLVFPEVNPDNVLNSHGVQITIVTTANSNEDGFALLKAVGIPFKK